MMRLHPKTRERLCGIGLLILLIIGIFTQGEANAHGDGVSTLKLNFDREVPGAVICYYERNFRATVRTGVKCPVFVGVRP